MENSLIRVTPLSVHTCEVSVSTVGMFAQRSKRTILNQILSNKSRNTVSLKRIGNDSSTNLSVKYRRNIKDRIWALQDHNCCTPQPGKIINKLVRKEMKLTKTRKSTLPNLSAVRIKHIQVTPSRLQSLISLNSHNKYCL